MGSLGQGCRHKIKAGRSPRMASQDTRESHPATRPKSETANGLVRIFRATRQMPAARPNQWRQRNPIKRNKATASHAREPGKCLMVRIEDHSSSSGSLDWFFLIQKFHCQSMSWNFLPFRGYSDFFTLDPNLASALRRTLARGYLALPKPSQSVDQPRQKTGLVARQG